MVYPYKRKSVSAAYIRGQFEKRKVMGADVQEGVCRCCVWNEPGEYAWCHLSRGNACDGNSHFVQKNLTDAGLKLRIVDIVVEIRDRNARSGGGS